jgi:hypothetical protein
MKLLKESGGDRSFEPEVKTPKSAGGEGKR